MRRFAMMDRNGGNGRNGENGKGGTSFSLLSLFALLVFLTAETGAQPLRAGGTLAPGEVLTADGTNDGVEVTPGPAIRFDPTADDRWAAFREVGPEAVSGFVYDGYLYTPARADSDRRRRRFGDDVTASVRSNAAHLAFAREKGVEREIALFVTKRGGGQAQVTVPAGLLGEERTFTFDLAPGEGRFVLLNATTPSYRAPYAPPASPRQTFDLTRWRFALDRDLPDGAEPWTEDVQHEALRSVAIPHTWNVVDEADPRGLADGVDVGVQYHRGVGWYVTSVDGFGIEDDHVVLRLEGVGNRAEVWLNGARVGETTRTYTRTDLVLEGWRPGPNHLAIRVDSRFHPDVVPHAADYTFYGGLYRGAQIVALPREARITDVRVTTPRVSAAEAEVSVVVRVAAPDRVPGHSVVTRVLDPSGGVVASNVQRVIPRVGSVSSTFTVPTPLLWGPGHPHLYSVDVTLVRDARGPGADAPIAHTQDAPEVADHVVEPLGFRFFAWTPDDGFALNGQRLQLRGVNLHQDGGPPLAWAAGPAATRRDLEMAQAMGANFVRLAHYPHHPDVVAHADTLGLVVWAEVPFITSDPTTPGFPEAVERMVRDMIERDGNHPSIVLWGLGNESLISWQTPEVQQAALRLAYRLNEVAKDLDPSRYTVQAQNHVVDVALDRPLPPAPSAPTSGAWTPRRYDLPAGIMATADIQARNQYAGWYEDAPEDIGPRLDRYHAEHPDWRLMLSEYGAGAQRGLWVEDSLAQPFDFSETWALRFHEAYLDALDARPFVAGGAVWHLFDFASHVKTGTLPHVNQKGLVTRDRQPKAVYYLYQSRWSAEPMAWLFANTRAHREAGAVRLEAFTNAPEATLFVDGEPLGVVRREGRSTRLGWEARLGEGARRLRLVASWPDGRTAVDEATVFVVPPGTLDASADGPVRLDGDN
ncbi:MAG: glycoside hydrolase family 2 TIM barrel-domain containing protein [Bacteroidota bacterium]